MPGDQATALRGGVALLERAITFALGSLQLVTREALHRPTPCRDWDLAALLEHLGDSVTTLAAIVDESPVATVPVLPADDPTAALRVSAGRLLGAWTAAGPRVVWVGLTGAVISGTGALELAVHGWDVGQACGARRPIPAALAEELLELAPLLVGADDRPHRFAPSLAVSTMAGPADRLLAYLGRHPTAPR